MDKKEEREKTDKLLKEKERLAKLQNEMNGSPVITIEEVYGVTPKGELELTHKKYVVTPRSPSSVSFTMDSKGNIKPEIKVYHEDPNEALRLSELLMKKALKASYLMVEDDN